MFECDGDVEVCETAKRAVRETAKLLTDKGHKVSVRLINRACQNNDMPMMLYLTWIPRDTLSLYMYYKISLTECTRKLKQCFVGYFFTGPIELADNIIHFFFC